MSKPMMKRIITAGSLVQMTIYPAVSPRDGPAARQGKRALSSMAQQRMNAKYAWMKLKLLIAANFGPRDVFGTLTYDGDSIPDGRAGVLRDVKAFMKRLRNARGDCDFRYIYVIEHKHGEGRWHVHILVNASGDDYVLIRRLWGRGNAEFRKIRVDREKNYETLARYLCKEERDKPGNRLWSGSRNLRKPQMDSFRVPADEPLKPPDGTVALLLDRDARSTPYGEYRYLEYVVKTGLVRPKPKPRRKGRREK